MITDVIGAITGNLTGLGTVTGHLISDSVISGELSSDIVIPYEGEYAVTPKMSEQVLLSRGKTMRDDVTVRKIPVAKTGNISGGYTVVIGG